MTFAHVRHGLVCTAVLSLLSLSPARADEEVDLAPPVDLEAAALPSPLNSQSPPGHLPLRPQPDPAISAGPLATPDQPVAVQLRGTLGFTYLRVSHPVPEEKHPRSGMLAVRMGNAEEVLSIRGMSGMKLKSGVWLFESNRPLDPGVSHIVRVEAREHPLDVDAVATRFVRLIPGRIVYLSFGEAAE
ncbi:MAG: hypothetical protein ACKPJJ_14025 [Planctomycetaceae bacterium]